MVNFFQAAGPEVKASEIETPTGFHEEEDSMVRIIKNAKNEPKNVEQDRDCFLNQLLQFPVSKAGKYS